MNNKLILIKKFTLVSLLALMCVTLFFGAFKWTHAYGEEDEETERTVAAIVGLQAADGYTLSADGYWREGESADGDYAFWQGMDADAALERIGGVAVEYDDGTQSVLPLGDGVTVTMRGSDTGNNATDNIEVSFDVSVDSDDGDPLTEICTLGFIQVKPYALQWVAGQSFTQASGLKSSTDIATDISTLGFQDEQLCFRMTSGAVGDTRLLTSSLRTEDTLTPVGSQWSELKVGDTYEKPVSVWYYENNAINRSIQPLSCLVKDIVFEQTYGTQSLALPTQLADQTAGEKLDYSELKVPIRFDEFGMSTASVPIRELPEDFVTGIRFFQDTTSKGEGKDFTLTTAINRALISYALNDTTGTAIVTFQVNQKTLSQPVVSDLKPTYVAGGVTVDISAIAEADVGSISYAASDSANAVLNEDNTSITFNKGGKFTLTVTLEAGEDGNYRWDTGSQSERPNNYTIVYTFEVANAPVEVELVYGGDGADRQYGDTENTLSHTVSLSYADGDLISGSLNKGDVTERDDDALPNYALRYFGWTENGVEYTEENPSAQEPRELGTYSVFAVTGKNGQLQAGKSNVVTFEITERLISFSPSQTSAVFRNEELTLEDFVDLASNSAMLAYDDAIENVMGMSLKQGIEGSSQIRHAGEYTVTISLTDTNYAWADLAVTERDKETEFTITPRDVSVSFASTSSTAVYGSGIKPVAVNEDGLKYNGEYLARIDSDPVYTNSTGATVQVADSVSWDVDTYTATYSLTGFGTGETDVWESDLNWTGDKSVTYSITPKPLTKVDISGVGGEYNKDGYGFTVNKWDTALSGIVNGDSGVLEIGVSGVLPDGVTKIVTNITNDDQDGTIRVAEAGTYTFTVTLKNGNYKWEGEKDGDASEVITLDGVTITPRTLALALDNESFNYDGANHVPTVSATNADGHTVTFTLSYFSVDGATETAIANPASITASGSYRIRITGFDIAEQIGSASYTYRVDFALADNAFLDFAINTADLQRVVLDAAKEGVSGTKVTVTYCGTNFSFEDYIANKSDYFYTIGGVDRPKVTIAIKKEGAAATLCGAGTYRVTVAPAQDFKWASGGERDEIVFTFVIEKLSVVIDWTGETLSQTYNGTALTVTGYKLNVCGNDDIDVVLTYSGDKISNGSAIDAGTYTVTATGLKGAASDNYTLTGGENLSNANFTIAPFALSAPVFANASETLTFGTHTQKNISLTDYTAAVSGFDWANAIGVTITGKWNFEGVNVPHGAYAASECFTYGGAAQAVFRFVNAGDYTLTFAIASDNFVWADGANPVLEFTVNRKAIDSPALGALRAQQWEDTIVELSTVLGGSSGGISYSVLYGENKEGGITSATQSAVDRPNGAAVRGQYYALLTISGDDKYNCVWQSVAYDNADKTGWAGGNFVNGGEVFKILYTKENGAQVYLYYAITASQVNITYEINHYEFGANGWNGSDFGLTVDDVLVMQNRNDVPKTANITVRFYQNGDEIIDLVNGLPWNAGTYDVVIHIEFEDSETYQDWDSSALTLVVSPRAVVITWTFGEGDSAQTGTNLSTIYNGEKQIAAAAISNVPKKSADDSAAAIVLKVNSTGANVNADSYTLTAVLEDNNYTLAGGTNLTCTFTIERFELGINANAFASDHTYGEAIAEDLFQNGEAWSYANGAKKFFGDDANMIGYRVIDGNGKEYAIGSPVGTYTVELLWNGAEKTSADGGYILTTENYVITVHTATLEVVARKITVTFTEGGATSVYGEVVNLYQNGVYSVTAGSIIPADQGDLSAIFTLSATKDGDTVTGDGTTANAGVYTVTGADVSDNYEVTFEGTGKYEILKAKIQNVSVSSGHESGDYDGVAYALFTGLAATVVNEGVVEGQTASWYYRVAGSNGEWTEYTDQTRKDVIDVTYEIMVCAPNHEDKILGDTVRFSIQKKSVDVTVNFEIFFGENSPAAYNGTDAYKADIGSLLTTFGGVPMYAFNGLIEGETITDIGLSGTFSYTTDYKKGDSANEYAIVFAAGTLSATNYTFRDGGNGKLTVKPLPVTVTVKSQTAVYYQPMALLAPTVVTEQSSSYEGGGVIAVYHAVSEIVTLSTAALTGEGASLRTNDAGVYPIAAAAVAANKDNYTITYTYLDSEGNAASEATYEITPAAYASVAALTGYNGEYDGSEHILLLAGGVSLETVGDMATTVDGSSVTVYFSMSSVSDWSAVTDTTIPARTNAGDYTIYYCITEKNHASVTGSVTAHIRTAENGFAGDYSLFVNAASGATLPENAAWVYGDYIAGSHESGYNANGDQAVNMPTMRFHNENVLTVTLSDGTHTQTVSASKSDTNALSELFLAFHNTYGFGAGNYTVVFEMQSYAVGGGQNNYNAFNATLMFRVEKKDITVRAENVTLTYGDEKPAFFAYYATGLVNGGTGTDTTEQVLSGGVVYFGSDYAAGHEKGTAGKTYAIAYNNAAKPVLDNYTVTAFVNGTITVNKKSVTVEIANAENYYDLIVLQNGSIATEEKAVLKYSVTGGGIIASDWNNGQPASLIGLENGAQKVFELRTDALTNPNDANVKTNDVLFEGDTLTGYPVYAVFLGTYADDYEISFAAGNKYSGTYAIPQNAVSTEYAGLFTIKQATLNVDFGTACNADGTPAQNGLYFSNSPKYYFPKETNGREVEFTVTYNGESEAPSEIGRYTVVATTANKNYVANVPSMTFEISPVQLLVSWVTDAYNVAASIQYGETLSGFAANGALFSGLKYKVTLADTNYKFWDEGRSEFVSLDSDGLIALADIKANGKGFETAYTAQSTVERYSITPSVVCSKNFAVGVNSQIPATLNVVAREIAVTVTGWGEGNTAATSPYCAADPLASGAWKSQIGSFLSVSKSDSQNAFVNGHTLSDLDVVLTISGTNYNASENPYKMIAERGSKSNSNYHITFVLGDGTVIDETHYPTYLITKKALTVTALDFEAVYGDALPALILNGTSEREWNDTVKQFVALTGWVESNNESYDIVIINDNHTQHNKFVFTVTGYTPYATGVGASVTVSVNADASVLEFTNYTVTDWVSGSIKVTPRPITASTVDRVYAEDGADFHNGAYGTAHEAVITFGGHNNGTGAESYNAAAHAPAFTLSYTTVAAAGQPAGKAPTMAGDYYVTVALTGQNYVFVNSGLPDNTTVTADRTQWKMPYSVLQQELGLRWENQNLTNNDTDVILTNTIISSLNGNTYVSHIMQIVPNSFQKTLGDEVTAIVEGDGPDTYAVGENGVGLTLTVSGAGEYRITLTLKETALRNYRWAGGEETVTLIFNVTASKVTINDLQIQGWIFGSEANRATFTVTNGTESGVQLSYAKIASFPAGWSAMTESEKLLWYKGLSYTSDPVNAGTYVLRAYYPTYQGVGGDEKFTTFTIGKATLSVPVIVQTFTFNGETLEATIEFDQSLMRISAHNITRYELTDSGAKLFVQNAGGYAVTFSLVSPENYEWSADGNVTQWTVAKAEDNEVVWDWKGESGSFTYGTAFVPASHAHATYGGTVYFYYMQSDSEPAANDAGWSDVLPTSVGNYWLKAVNLGDERNYNAAEPVVVAFRITPATLTLVPTGTIEYGTAFIPTAAYEFEVLGLQYSDGEGVIQGSAEGFAIVDMPEKLVVGNYEIRFITERGTDVVSGLTAANYIIVSGTGSFDVTPKAITVAIGNVSSQYGTPIDCDGAEYEIHTLAYAGDDLGLVFATDAGSTPEKSVVGGYLITAQATGADAKNYTIGYVPGTYTITQRMVYVTLVAGGGTYGGAITEVSVGTVTDESGADITEAVKKDNFNITVIYNGTANDGTAVTDSTQRPSLAGSYMATVTGSDNANYMIYGTSVAQFVIAKRTIPAVSIPSQAYTGGTLYPAVGENEYYTVDMQGFVNAGTHYITLTLKDSFNTKWEAVETASTQVQFVIEKAINGLTGGTGSQPAIQITGWVYGEFNAAVNLPKATSRFGTVVFYYSAERDGTFTTAIPADGNAGTYWVRAAVAGSDNYEVFDLSDCEPVSFTISPRRIAAPVVGIIAEGEEKNDVYTGRTLYFNLTGYDPSLMTFTYDGRATVNGSNVSFLSEDAGTYRAYLSFLSANYAWGEGTEVDGDGNAVLVWTVARKKIARPTANNNTYIVNGNVLNYLPIGFDAGTMKITGNESAYGGNFEAEISLIDPSNYMWEDGSDDPFTIAWSVVGVNTVFTVVVTVVSAACFILLILALAQCVVHRRDKRWVQRSIEERSAEDAESTEGGNRS